MKTKCALLWMRLSSPGKSRHELSLVFLFFAVLSTRLFLLQPGYGLDADAWRLANAAKRIAESGIYQASRLPGYPIPEIVYSLLPIHTPILFNLITALFSALAVVEFARIGRRIGVFYPILTAWVLALTPLFFINSCVTMDYIWAVALILFSYSLVLDRRFLGAGLCLGLAIGCRLTTAAVILPFLLTIHSLLPRSERIRTSLRFLAFTLVTATLCYTPVLDRYGWSFLTFYETGYPQATRIVYRLTVEVWGVTGLGGLLVAVIWSLLREKRRHLFSHPVAGFTRTAWTAVLLFLAVFFRLPHEAEYLLAALPFFLLLLNLFLGKRPFLLFASAVILSPIFLGVHHTDFVPISPSPLHFSMHRGKESLFLDFIKGPLWIHQEKRADLIRRSRRIVDNLAHLPKPAIVVTGWWHEFFDGLYSDEYLQQPNIRLQRLLEPEDMGRSLMMGTAIYYLPGQDETQYILTGIDLHHYGGRLYDGSLAPEDSVVQERRSDAKEESGKKDE